MTSSEQTNNWQAEIGLSEILKFLKLNYGRILIFAFFSFLSTALILLSAYFLLPKEVSFVSEVNIHLFSGFPKKSTSASKQQVIYPSTTPFSANDLLSPAVLKKIYDDNKLSERIKFDDFYKLFYLSQMDIKKSLLMAEYTGKITALSKKISVVELQQLKTEFEEELQKLSRNTVRISMLKDFKISQAESIRILNSLPQVWFQIYSKREAKKFPVIETPAQIRSLNSAGNLESRLFFLNRVRGICRNLEKACAELEEILDGQKVILPSGELLTDLHNRLIVLNNQKIHPMLLLVCKTPALQKNLDELFLKSNIFDHETKVKAEKAKLTGTFEALNILQNKEITNTESNITENAGKNAMTMISDASFLQYLQTLILQNSANTETRVEYAKKVLDLEQKIADISAEKDYFTNLLNHWTEPKKVSQISVQEFQNAEKAMFDELLTIAQKVNDFRDLIFKDHIQKSSFYSSNGEVLKESEFWIPFKRIAAGLVLLAALINAIYISILFYTNLNRVTQAEADK